MKTFADWLQGELNKRDWNQAEFVKHIQKTGYSVSRSQVTHVLNETRQAGVDAAIAFAHALGVSREEVFRARGWLLREPSQVIPPQASAQATEVIRELTSLPIDTQETASVALLGVLRAISQVREENASEGVSEALQEEREDKVEVPKSALELLPFLAELEELPKPVRRETIDTILGHLTTTLKMHQRVEWLSDWFQQEFPERYEEIEAQLAARYDRDGRVKVSDHLSKKAA